MIVGLDSPEIRNNLGSEDLYVYTMFVKPGKSDFVI